MKLRTHKKSVLILSLLLRSLFSLAQGDISGKVLSGDNNEELPFANILLTNVASDSTIGQVSELNGDFIFKKIPQGEYKIEVSVIGYENSIIDHITMADSNIKLPKIMMKPSAVQLDEVRVTAERSYIESKPGKKIINIGQDIVNSGGSAVALLGMVPSVEVSVSGNISIRGLNDVFVLINGRETALSFLGAGQALKKIPISSIERIEIITNGGADMGPDGDGGMINVILKKNKQEGTEYTFGGNMSMNPISNSLNAGVEHRKGKFGYSLNYEVEKERDKYSDNSIRNYKNIVNGNKGLIENSQNNEEYLSQFFMGGISYQPNLNSETALTLFLEKGESNSTLTQHFGTIRTNGQSVNSTNIGDSKGKENFVGAEITHSQEFKNDRSLELYSSIYSGSSENNVLNVLNSENTTAQNSSHNKSDFSSVGAEMEYSMPLGELLNLNTGAEVNYMKFDVDQLATNEGRSQQNNYSFKQNKLSYYATTDVPLGPIDLTLGGRLEYYTSKGQPDGGGEFNQEYFNIYPNLQAMTSFGSEQYEQSLMFSYSKRINRPEFDQLNPTVNYYSSISIVQGNPNLEPEFAHVMELGHELQASKFSLSTTFFQRITTNVIQERRELLPNNVILLTYANESQRNNMGIETYLKYDITNWLDISNDFTIYNKAFRGSDTGFNNRINWSNKTITNIRPVGGVKIQLQFKYVGKQNTLYHAIEPYSTLNIGVSKDIMKSKGKVFLSVSDVFNTIKLTSSAVQKDFVTTNITKYNTRMLNIGFLLNFK